MIRKFGIPSSRFFEQICIQVIILSNNPYIERTDAFVVVIHSTWQKSEHELSLKLFKQTKHIMQVPLPYEYILLEAMIIGQ